MWGGEEARRRRETERHGAGQVAVLNTEGHRPRWTCTLHTLAAPGLGPLGEPMASGLEGKWGGQCIPPNLNLGDMSPLEARLRQGANIYRHPTHIQAPNVNLARKGTSKAPRELPSMWSGQGAGSEALLCSGAAPKVPALPGVYWSLCAQKAQVKVLGGLRRLQGEGMRTETTSQAQGTQSCSVAFS